MINEFKYVLVEFYNGGEHVAQLYKNLKDIATELDIHRSTFHNNYDIDDKVYHIIKDKKEYYIKKLT
jgi:hypothetical protein